MTPATLLLLTLSGAAMAVGAACFLHRDPERRFRPPGGKGLRAESLPIADHADAKPLLLSPDPGPPDHRERCVVVFAHGGGNDRLFGMWYLADALLAAGHTVLAGHLPGHGRGGTDRFALSEARTRIDALVAEATRIGDGAPVAVVGQSIGAAVALDQLARGVAPGAVVAVSAPADGLGVGARLATEALALLRPPAYHALRYGNPYAILPAAGGFKRRLYPIRVRPGESYLDTFDRVVKEMELPRRLAEATDGSALLVHGGLDGVIPVQQVHLLADALGDRAELAVFDRATHLDPLLDREIVGRILDWLDGLAAHP